MSKRKKSRRRWDTRAAERAFQRNKGRVEAGETYRSQAPSTYRRKMKRIDQ